MRLPYSLPLAFGEEFENWIAEFAVNQGLMPDSASLSSKRYLARSIAPHISKLSSRFNREKTDQKTGLTPYWKESSHPENLRLAYFLYFMPCNLYRTASVWAELHRLGFKWPHSECRAIEFGAGPAAASCGIFAGEKHAPLGLPSSISFALIEQDKGMLDLGAKWLDSYGRHLGFTTPDVRPFHRTLDIKQGFLPKQAPSFHLWLMSFYLNELDETPGDLARALLKSWDQHLEQEGLIILVEPALKQQSRKLLELRKSILEHDQKHSYQILTPCFGHQICGALQNPEDWCHEEVSWWRPPYFRILDDLCKLDRKSLPFSYLVIMKTKRKREELLPALEFDIAKRERLVSPSHKVAGKDQEFFVCGQSGKRRVRYHSKELLERGDALMGAEIRGDVNAGRLDRFKKKT